MTAQKPSIYGPFPTPDKAKPWKLGMMQDLIKEEEDIPGETLSS